MKTFIRMCAYLRGAGALNYNIVYTRLCIIELTKQLQTNLKINSYEN